MESQETVPGVWHSWLRQAFERLVIRPAQGFAAIVAGLQQAGIPLAGATARVATKELSHQERARVDHGAALIADGVRALAVPVFLGALLLAWFRPIVLCVLAAALLCVAA